MNVVDTNINTESIYGDQSFVYFDIETIPCQDTAYLDKLRDEVTAPARYKKQESIDEWLAENRDKEAADALSKTSFDGGKGHVCTIAWAKNDGAVVYEHAKTTDEEKEVIKRFFFDLDPYHSETLVGHNITGFDIGFLRKRAVVLGVPMPHNSSFPRDPKPWDKSVNDTMTMWAGGAGKISMDNLCSILGINGKEGFDGSMVAEAWASGNHGTIIEYCKDDIRRTREIHQRFLKAGW